MVAVSLAEIVAALGGELVGDPGTLIERLGPLETADSRTLAFLANPRYRSQLEHSAAGCVIVATGLREAASARGACIVAADPYLYFAHLTRWWAARHAVAPAPGVHATAVVDAAAQVAADAVIGALAVIEADAVIEAGAMIGAQSFVGRGARIGPGTRLAPRVVVMSGCRIGAHGIVHSGVVIGADGFGFAPDQGRWVKIEQLGAVVIGDDVEIGANTCIDRGALGDTVIGNGVKLDNQIQIGHNVRIGDHTAMAGCVGVAGSARIGAHCTIAGGVGIAGHLEICDHVHVSAMTLVSRSIHQPGRYSGSFPFDENAAWEKNAATLRQLHSLRDRLRALEKKNA